MSAELRAARAELVADRSLRGPAFGRALSDVLDAALVGSTAGIDGPDLWALLALGSYGRRELCPGSDVDVLLLHTGGRRARSLTDDASRLWYPLWDAGFILGHAVRTVKEAISLADDEIDALTSVLDMRLLAGDAELAAELVTKAHQLAPRRRSRMVARLAAAADARFSAPGPIAEMLAPDLKNGAGGLRDVQAAGWVGWALAGSEPSGASGAPIAAADGDGWRGGTELLVVQGYLRADDVAQMATHRELLLDARVALHRVTNGRVDQLPLQEQDAVAEMLGVDDADALLHELGAAARSVAWITSDLWGRLLSTERGPRGRGTGERLVGDHVVLRDGRTAFVQRAVVDTEAVLALAARTAELDVPIDRDSLDLIAQLRTVEWTLPARDDFIALLGAGRGTVAVFETLDHVGLLVRLLPEWRGVRARPQRNAYHRYTVDRHSLEAVVECATLLDPASPTGSGFDGEVARRAPRDVLLLSALLHDVGKGSPGDHSVVGVDIARSLMSRIGLDDAAIERVTWLVRHHLLLVDTATRRDLSDEQTITRFGREVADVSTLDALYVLTIGDSVATGSSAWSRSKAMLVRELYLKAAAWIVDGAAETADDTRELLERTAEVRAARVTAVEWFDTAADLLEVVVVAPDATGMLARVAGALSLHGFDIADAAVVTDDDGMAVECFHGVDRFGRLAETGRDEVTEMLIAALDGDAAFDVALRERARRYRRPTQGADARDVRVVVDLDASQRATVVEVHAPDEVGLLARIAEVFASLRLDVTRAFVSTVGERVVDVFYLRDITGAKVTDIARVAALRTTVVTRVTAELAAG
ncbi:MAG TPA: ACT domain-containing protein [Gaiellaceae bacterium]|nr:ACT domain-containing protein [Gaiellaceae bacterium]